MNILTLILQLLKSSSNWLANQLALFFEKTKISNPLAYTVLMAVATGLLWVGNNCVFDVCQSEWVVVLINILSLAIMALTKPSSWQRAQVAKGNVVTVEETEETTVTTVTKK